MVTIVSIVIQPIAAQGYNGCSRDSRYSSYGSYDSYSSCLGHIIQIHFMPNFYINCTIRSL